jgi:hypothetical protein
VPAKCEKAWDRFQEKKEEAYKAMNNNAYQYRRNNFRVISDFARGQLPCAVTEISSKIEEIRKVVLSAGGKMWARKKYFALEADGEHKDKSGKFIDLAVFAYVRMPSKGLTPCRYPQVSIKKFI